MILAILFWTFVIISVSASLIALLHTHKRAKVAREAMKKNAELINKAEAELLRQLLVEKLAGAYPITVEVASTISINDEGMPTDKSGR